MAAILAVLMLTSVATLAQQSSVSENYRIGPGDIIDITVSKNDALSRSGVRVTNTGTIQLAMLDQDMPAACMTERELADTIRDRYKKFLIEPHVNVTVREFNAIPVAVIGAVNSPGRFQMQRTVRLMELLTYVNGTAATAGKTVEIVRDPGRPYCEDDKLVMPGPAAEKIGRAHV